MSALTFKGEVRFREANEQGVKMTENFPLKQYSANFRVEESL